MSFLVRAWIPSLFLSLGLAWTPTLSGQFETSSSWQVPVDLIVISDDFRLQPVQQENRDGLYPSRRRARLRVVSADTLEVTLETPLRVPLYRGYQLDPVAERRLQSFRLQTSPAEIALLSQLRLGDSLVTSDETLDSMDRIRQAERPVDHDPLIQEIMDRRTSLPRVYRFRSIVLPVPLELVGRATPAPIDFIRFMGEAQQLPWAEFTYAGEKESIYKLDVIHQIFHQGDPFLLSYRAKVNELIYRMAQLRHRGWLFSQRERGQAAPRQIESPLNQSPNMTVLPSRMRCAGLFR